MRIYEQLTPKTCLKYLENMNFKYLTSFDYKYYTTCIGGFRKGTTSEEMAAGYATLKNDGVYREPTCISKITTSDGDEVMSSSTKKRRVYSTSAANAMTDVLKSVITGGTGVGAKVPNVDTAGKTGTTNLNKDGWFCGYTPYYTTAVWVGRDDNRIMEGLSGASYPKSIWSNFMNEIHSEYSSTDSMGGNYTDYQERLHSRQEHRQQQRQRAAQRAQKQLQQHLRQQLLQRQRLQRQRLRQRLLQRQHNRQKNSQQRISKKNIEIIKNHR